MLQALKAYVAPRDPNTRLIHWAGAREIRPGPWRSMSSALFGASMSGTMLCWRERCKWSSPRRRRRSLQRRTALHAAMETDTRWRERGFHNTRVTESALRCLPLSFKDRRSEAGSCRVQLQRRLRSDATRCPSRKAWRGATRRRRQRDCLESMLIHLASNYSPALQSLENMVKQVTEDAAAMGAERVLRSAFATTEQCRWQQDDPKRGSASHDCSLSIGCAHAHTDAKSQGDMTKWRRKLVHKHHEQVLALQKEYMARVRAALKHR